VLLARRRRRTRLDTGDRIAAHDLSKKLKDRGGNAGYGSRSAARRAGRK
jgi:hypothetical protein